MKQVDFPDRANTGDPSKFGNGVAPPVQPQNNGGGSCILGVIGSGCDNNGGNTGNQNNGNQNNGGNTGNQNNGNQNNGGTGNQNNGGTGNQNNDVTVLPGPGGTNADNGG
jgi:hypothetical protein